MNTHAAGGDDRDNALRIGRQMYDIWALLGDERVIAFLTDRRQTSTTLGNCYEISKMFRPASPQPSGGFAESPAFDLGSDLANRLSDAHDLAMSDFYYGTASPPGFGQIVQRIRSHASLLAIDKP